MTGRIKRAVPVATVLILGTTAGLALLPAQGLLGPELPSDSICTRFLRPGRQIPGDGSGGTASPNAILLGRLTESITAQLPGAAVSPGGSRTATAVNTAGMGLVDQYIFSALQSAGIQPAEPTTDWEFIRRATLDLTGRIPASARVLSFVSDPSPTKRAALVDELIAGSTWVDKWTMYFGDLYKNNSANSQIRRFPSGVTAFRNYIRTALQQNKPYDQVAKELISTQGASSYVTGELNFNVGGVVTGGPLQDVWDQQTANIAGTFLGVAHVNCLLCHNGAGHLTDLSLWGSKQTRVSAWGLSSFMSQSSTINTPVSPGANEQFWSITDGITGRSPGRYNLNTTTGNRPQRQPIGSVSSITPAYIFTGETPQTGENYRQALARMVVADPQFARATVNQMWAYFFGIGLVDPVDAFDPSRLDPDKPPPAPWTLQPSNPRLLNALANAFIANKYDLRWLMRTLVNSQAYQLQSRYNGEWNVAWNNLFGRKLVRRLWAEEIHDAIAISSNSVPTYTSRDYGNVNYAMQLSEPVAQPDGATGKVTAFLDAFLRGNRDDELRADDGSILQALNLMNDSFVMTRTSPTSPAGALLPSNLSKSNTDLVNTLFLAVLSRYPTAAELAISTTNLANTQTRNQEAQYLLWSLYNKVDFTFNY